MVGSAVMTMVMNRMKMRVKMVFWLFISAFVKYSEPVVLSVPADCCQRTRLKIDLDRCVREIQHYGENGYRHSNQPEEDKLRHFVHPFQ
jgi:hypothetical protein